MSSSKKDTHLHNPHARPSNLHGRKEISSSTTLSFTSQLSSLINTSSATTTSRSKPTSSRLKPKKDDIFTTHNRNTAKRARRDLESDTSAFQQKHTTNGESLDSGAWERSKRKMEEKARLYAAIKRGDIEDTDEKYAVDFDKKWAEKGGKDNDSEQDEDSDDDAEPEMIQYTDEFGRTRTGTRLDAARVQRQQAAQSDLQGDRFTARPSAPSNVIYGDTIQHSAFNPDDRITDQMQDLAAKRDRSLTPPPDSHFDSRAEVRTKGTGFFSFSGESEERKKQMEGLEAERADTERRRKQRESKLDERKAVIEARRREIAQKRGKRKADDFLEELGVEIEQKEAVTAEATDAMQKIQEAVDRENDDDDNDIA